MVAFSRLLWIWHKWQEWQLIFKPLPIFLECDFPFPLSFLSFLSHTHLKRSQILSLVFRHWLYVGGIIYCPRRLRLGRCYARRGTYRLFRRGHAVLASLVARLGLNFSCCTGPGVRVHRHGFSTTGDFVAIESLATKSFYIEIVTQAVQTPTPFSLSWFDMPL